MSPEERAALLRVRARLTLLGSGVAVFLIGLCAVIAWLPLGNPDFRQHFWGSSTKVQVEVVAVERHGTCRSTERWQLTVEWTQDGTPRSDQVRQCGNQPDQVGDTRTAWATDDDTFNESPMIPRLLIPLALLGFGLLTGWALRNLFRSRRAARRVLSGEPPAVVWQTAGTPWTTRFSRLTPDGAIRIKRSAVTHIHSTPSSSPPIGPLRGQLVASDLRRGRPRGVILHASVDGARQWWFV